MTITLSVEEYFELCKAEAELEALEAAGVDNWGGYDYRHEHEEFAALSSMTVEEFEQVLKHG